MKQTLLIIALWAIALASNAQKLIVKSFEQDISDISAQKYRVNDANDEACALIKVSFAEPDVEFEGDYIKAEHKKGEYWVYMTDGAEYINVKTENYPALRYEFPEPVQKLGTYILVIQKKEKEPLSFSDYNQFYMDAFFQAGGMMGVGATIGAHFHAINVEAEVSKGVTKSAEVFWYDNNNLIAQSTYSALSGNVKMGYGFQFGKKFFVTPQAGFGLVKCFSDSNNPGKDANAAYALVGCRGTFIFARRLQVVVAPYYNVAIKKSTSFEEISSVCNTLNDWANGFNVKVGLSIFL